MSWEGNGALKLLLGKFKEMQNVMQTTRCAVHTRPWYGMRIERLQGVENPSRRVTRENVTSKLLSRVHERIHSKMNGILVWAWMLW